MAYVLGGPRPDAVRHAARSALLVAATLLSLVTAAALPLAAAAARAQGAAHGHTAPAASRTRRDATRVPRAQRAGGISSAAATQRRPARAARAVAGSPS